jgi:hypothetical protein
VVANIIAGLSLTVSCFLAIFYLLDRRHARFSIKRDHVDNLLRWHSEVVQLLARLRLVSLENPGAREKDLALLSAKIEEGRFFFPNIDRSDGFGADKPPAYQGYRNLALDFLVASYNLFSNDDRSTNLAQAASLQRHFTSVVFEIVRPHERLKEIRKLTDRYFIKEHSFENFLETGNSEVIEHVWRAPRAKPLR